MAITKTIFSNHTPTEVYNFLNSSNFFDSVTLTENVTHDGKNGSKITCKDSNVTVIEFFIEDSYKYFTGITALKSKNNAVSLNANSYNNTSYNFGKGYYSSKGVVLVGADDGFIIILAKTKTTNHKVLITNIGGDVFNKWGKDLNNSNAYVYTILDTVDDEGPYFPTFLTATPATQLYSVSEFKESFVPYSEYASKNTILIPEYTYEGAEIDGLYRRIYSPRDVAQMNTCRISFGNKEYIFDGNYALEE